MMKKAFLALAITGALVCTPSCGALLFPERQHAVHSDKVDPNIVLLDGLGLLLFIVPGLVAFGVDFYTGAIYLPEGEEQGQGPFFGDREEALPE